MTDRSLGTFASLDGFMGADRASSEVIHFFDQCRSASLCGSQRRGGLGDSFRIAFRNHPHVFPNGLAMASVKYRGQKGTRPIAQCKHGSPYKDGVLAMRKWYYRL